MTTDRPCQVYLSQAGQDPATGRQRQKRCSRPAAFLWLSLNRHLNLASETLVCRDHAAAIGMLTPAKAGPL